MIEDLADDAIEESAHGRDARPVVGLESALEAPPADLGTIAGRQGRGLDEGSKGGGQDPAARSHAVEQELSGRRAVLGSEEAERVGDRVFGMIAAALETTAVLFGAGAIFLPCSDLPLPACTFDSRLLGDLAQDGGEVPVAALGAAPTGVLADPAFGLKDFVDPIAPVGANETRLGPGHRVRIEDALESEAHGAILGAGAVSLLLGDPLEDDGVVGAIGTRGLVTEAPDV